MSRNIVWEQDGVRVIRDGVKGKTWLHIQDYSERLGWSSSHAHTFLVDDEAAVIAQAQRLVARHAK